MSKTPAENLPRCTRCGVPDEVKICVTHTGRGPENCPTLHNREAVDEARRLLTDPQTREFARQASIQEAECYIHRDRKPFVAHPVKPRLQEIIEFAHRMGYHRLGLVFCEGLRREAAAVARVLSRQGFEVVSAVCKVGGVPKEEIGIAEEQKILIGEEETMCNPLAQAELMNRAQTQLNVLMGLCVGHDSLFFKQAKAFTTVLAVKDRVTGHNPLAVVYTLGSYSERFLSADLDPNKAAPFRED
jgi:uncharacterized metal-binding protein